MGRKGFLSYRGNVSSGQPVEPLERRALLAAVPVGPEFGVNAHTPADQNRPVIAADADGDFVVVWESAEQDGSSSGIVARRFSSSGAPQGAEFLVNTCTTGAQTSPSVAMDDAGNFVIAWTSDGQDGSLAGAYAQRYSAAGAPRGGEFRLNTYTTQEQDFPRVAMDADGDFVVAWESFAQDGDEGDGVFVRRFDAAGNALGAEFLVNTYTTNHQFHAVPAMDDDGDFVVTWISKYQDGSAYGIYAQRYSASGAPQGTEFRANTYTFSDQAYPSVAMDADGDFVIAWSSYLQDGSHWGAYFQRYDAAGAPQGAETRANTFTTGAQFLPVAAMDEDGKFVITWNGRGPLASSEVWARQYDASGAPRGDAAQVNTHAPSNQHFAAVAMDDDGDFVVAWMSQYQDGDGYGIFAQRYAVAPEVAASSFAFLTAPHALRFDFNVDVSASLGTEDLVVQNLTTGQTVPAGDVTLAYDTATNVATFSYTGSGGGMSGVLPDGNYRATIVAAGVSSGAGAAMGADHVLEFFFLGADATRDGRVNLSDFNVLAANFGQSNRDFTQGDVTYDGVVNLSDFNILAARFGHVLGSSAAPRGYGPDRSAEDDSDELLA